LRGFNLKTADEQQRNKDTKKRPDHKTIPLFTSCKSLHPEDEGSFDPILHSDFVLDAWLFIFPLQNLGSRAKLGKLKAESRNKFKTEKLTGCNATAKAPRTPSL
jgi:hypothetical protein